MKGTEDTRETNRYIALDIHKEYVLAGGQIAGQDWVMAPRRISIVKFREWATANLYAGDAVVLETTTNVWDIYDSVAPLPPARWDSAIGMVPVNVVLEASE